VSHAGGGLKRLHEFARWFDARGGAAFVIHESCGDLPARFPANHYFRVAQSTFGRLIDDWSYLDPIRAELGSPELYFAYGIPVYRRVGSINWFHLSNVIPFNVGRIPLPAIDYLRQPFLAWRYQRNLKHADIVSAESRASLRHLRVADPSKLFVSVNGSDDELTRAAMPPVAVPDDTAVVVGTYKYKAIRDSYGVFQSLKADHPRLRMIVIGVSEQVPEDVRRAPDVICTGVLPRAEVVKHLERASFYISTTLVENSYNAASEGVFLARESFVSDIPPHRELLGDGPLEMVSFPGVRTQLIHVRREDISTATLKTWDQVVTEMLDRAGIAAA
jgi:hypothetical protein